MEKQPKILVADDDPLIVASTRRILESAGFETLIAQDGQEAVELTRAQRPDLLLLDVNMPKLDGFEVCRQIKADPTLAGIFIIIMTSTHTHSDSQSDGLNIGADGYIARPIGNRELLARVQAMLRIRSAENSLRASISQWSATFDAVSDAIFLTDASYTILNCNRAATKMWSDSPEALIGKKCYQVAHGAETPVSACPLAMVCETKHRQVITFAQNDRWLEAKVDPMFDASGNFSGTVHVVTDITERMNTEKALRESEDKFKYVFDHSVIGKSITLPSGKINVNQAFCETLGYSQLELQNSNWQEISHLDDIELTQNAVNELLSGEKDWIRFIKRYIHKDGSTIWADVGTSLRRDQDGKPLYFMTSINDITARKQAEDALKEYNTRLETAVEAATSELLETQKQLVHQEKLAVLGQLANSVGHELRNPLGIINNAVYFLNLVQPDAEPKIKEYLEIIQTETHIANQIINDLLDFSRIKSVDVEPVAVPDLVWRTMERFVVPENVRVTVNLPDNLPIVYVDPRQIMQALGNLVINACQAMVTAGSKGGNLVISGQEVTISEQQFFTIAVKDTGVGIPPENINKLFEPLFTTKAKGIGLGLAVSKNLVEANGGKIEVESKPGKGSTFTIFLPVKQ